MVDDSRVAMGPALLHNPTAQEQMSQFISLSEAAASLIGDGDIVAMEGFTDTIASAAGHELIRPGCPYLTVIRMTAVCCTTSGLNRYSA
jgi:acyl CoA:acetate/3-ketoacid CoA transferase alpha subunit